MPLPVSDEAMLKFCRDLLGDLERGERPSAPELQGSLQFSVRRIEALENLVSHVRDIVERHTDADTFNAVCRAIERAEGRVMSVTVRRAKVHGYWMLFAGFLIGFGCCLLLLGAA